MAKQRGQLAVGITVGGEENGGCVEEGSQACAGVPGHVVNDEACAWGPPVREK